MNIKELAEQAGLGTTSNDAWYPLPIGLIHLERFAELVAAAEREACAKLCVVFGPTMNGYGCAAAIRARGDGIALTNTQHPEGNPVSDDHELNPDSLETVEIEIPMSINEINEAFDREYEIISKDPVYRIIRACGLSTANSDINVLALERIIEDIKAAEREACAKLCEEKALYFQYDFIAPYDVADSCAEEIRARGDKHD